jgi:hypothetical protein
VRPRRCRCARRRPPPTRIHQVLPSESYAENNDRYHEQVLIPLLEVAFTYLLPCNDRHPEQEAGLLADFHELQNDKAQLVEMLNNTDQIVTLVLRCAALHNTAYRQPSVLPAFFLLADGAN